jgi:mannose-1-phosphate guanylyltransferase
MKKNKSNYVAIMAGGVGSRFWPASREHTPKQFLDILGVGKSLIRLTYERFANIVDPENILVVTNKIYKDLVIEHIPEIPEKNIITEPSRNNTGPCVAYTALRLEAMDPDASFVIAPSDHVILKEEAFLNKIDQALTYASKEEVIVTLGIEPTRPDTGYGYIETNLDGANSDVIKVKQFREKPDVATAESYIKKGGYYWNAGIFIWSVKTILNSFKKYAPEIYDILSEDKSKYNTDAEQEYIDEVYPRTPSISVDYAILENAVNVYTIPADIGWSDLGTWNALHAYKDKDATGSVVIGDNTMMVDSKNCIVKSDSKKLVVIKDLDNYIIIDEPDVLLVYPKDKEQSIKQLQQSIEDKSYK